MTNINELYDCYKTIKQEYDSLSLRCKTADDRQLLAEKYRTIAEQYQLALNKTFEASNNNIILLRAELNAQRVILERMLRSEEQFANIATVLTTIAETAVRIVQCKD